MTLTEELRQIIKGEASDDTDVLITHSRDTSLFQVQPAVVVFPKDSDDIQRLVNFVAVNKKSRPDLSLTARAAGTDMTGGPLNESIIVNFTRHFNRIKKVDEDNLEAVVEPGVYYRDFEKETLPEHLTLPTYPASKSIAAIGGMVANNAGGERSLRFGKTADYITSLQAVLADGREYQLKPMVPKELAVAEKRTDFLGQVCRELRELLEKNYDLIKKAEPKVSKNSAGYALWRVWNRQKFDLTQLFAGAQGTLGLITEITFRLVKNKSKKRLIAVFFKTWDELPKAVTALLPHQPDSLETFDRETLKLGLRFMPEIANQAGQNLLVFATRFWPEFLVGLKMLGLPKLVVLVELAEDTIPELNQKTDLVIRELKRLRLNYRVTKNERESDKYWIMRRQSFNLLRKHIKGKRTAPFVEDFCLKPELVPEFLPQAIKILRDHKIDINIAGHAGNGNFHIIPLMDLRLAGEREKIITVADKFYDLVIKYGGSITAEHNDGIIRTPYLEKMYGPDVYNLFRQVKKIFDPQNIFNPGKKVGGSLSYVKDHMATE